MLKSVRSKTLPVVLNRMKMPMSVLKYVQESSNKIYWLKGMVEWCLVMEIGSESESLKSTQAFMS